MSEPRETSGVTTRLIVTYIRTHHGDDGVRRLLRAAGETRPVAVLEDERSWSTYPEKIALFEAAEEVTGDPSVAWHIGASLLESRIAGSLRPVVRALGSPRQVLRSIARANAKFNHAATMRCLRASRRDAVVTYRLHAGHRPSRHDCAYTQGLLTQVTVLFGLPPARIAHPRCQVTDGDHCRFELSWPAWRRLLRPRRPAPGGLPEAEVDALRQQLLDLQRTVADLVATDDLDTVLQRIATRAGAAVRGQRYLLAARLDGESTPRIHGDGFADEEAARRGRALLDGTGDGDDPSVLVVPVASARRHYGRLAAYLPTGTGFLPAERPQLEAFAGLAAAALDAATALAQARRRGRITEALLTLARELARQEDEVAIAQRVVAAVPTVTGASRSTLLLMDAERTRLRAVAASGYGDRHDRARALEIPRGATPALDALLAAPAPAVFTRPVADPWIEGMLEAFDAVAVATAPIVVRGEVAGLVLAGWAAPGPPPADDATLRHALSGLGDQAAGALTTVRLLERARHQATHDDLTGLANRALFHTQIEQALADHDRTGDRAAVCFVDLDGFKRVNDERGHAAGDELLITVAERIRAAVRASDVVARLSGDEFGVLLRGVQHPDDAERVAGELVAVLGRPASLAVGEVCISASVGVALLPDHGTTPEELLRQSDAAMYRAKRVRGTYRFVGAEDDVETA